MLQEGSYARTIIDSVGKQFDDGVLGFDNQAAQLIDFFGAVIDVGFCSRDYCTGTEGSIPCLYARLPCRQLQDRWQCVEREIRIISLDNTDKVFQQSYQIFFGYPMVRKAIVSTSCSGQLSTRGQDLQVCPAAAKSVSVIAGWRTKVDTAYSDSASSIMVDSDVVNVDALQLGCASSVDCDVV